MAATPPSGVPAVDDGQLISTNPATGVEVGRFPVASASDVADAVSRAREAADWWADLGFDGRRKRLLHFRSLLTQRLDEVTALMNAEGGKPHNDALVEGITAIDHIAWAATHARQELGPRRGSSSVLLKEHTSRLEYL